MATHHPATTPVFRERDAPRTRAAILEAAGRIFADAGLAGARTDAIAEAADVNKALLYYYFKSKEALYRAVLEEQLKDFHRQLMETLRAGGPPRSVLMRYASLHFDFVSGRRCLAPLFQQVMMTGGRSLQHLVQKYFAPRNRAVARLIERGVRKGDFRAVDANHAAFSIAAVIVSYFSCEPVMRLLGRTDAYSAANLQRRKKEVLDFIRYGLFADPEGPLE